MTKLEKRPGLWWVATYGDMGLEVEHFDDPLAYGRAIREAEQQHGRGELDSYTYGDAMIIERAKT